MPLGGLRSVWPSQLHLHDLHHRCLKKKSVRVEKEAVTRLSLFPMTLIRHHSIYLWNVQLLNDPFGINSQCSQCATMLHVAETLLLSKTKLYMVF